MRLRFFILSLCIFVCFNVKAAMVSDLNVATIPVKNASTAERETALTRALSEVLIKFSGNSAIMTLPKIQNSVTNINEFIQSYRYFQKENASDGDSLQLQVTFDKSSIKQLLKNAGQPVWSPDRPLTLLWLDIKDNEGQQILSSTTNTLLSQTIERVAKSRGLPILFPAMDLQDQSLINVNDFESIDTASFKSAAQRYEAKSILAGRIYQDASNQWVAEWLLWLKDAPYRWSSRADSIDDLCVKGINYVTNLMVNQLAVANDQALQTMVTLKIHDVLDLDDYAKVLKILRQLPPVSEVDVDDMSNTNLVLKVKVVGGEQALSDALSSQKVFSMVNDSDNTEQADGLAYRWNASHSQNVSSQQNEQQTALLNNVVPNE